MQAGVDGLLRDKARPSRIPPDSDRHRAGGRAAIGAKIAACGLVPFSARTCGGEGQGEVGLAGPRCGGATLLTLTLSSLKEGGEGNSLRFGAILAPMGRAAP
jgi:hypothetical protein